MPRLKEFARFLIRVLNWRLIAILGGTYWLYHFPTHKWGSDDNLILMINLFTLATLATSWNIIGGYVNHVNLGLVAFFGIGSVVTREYWLVKEYDLYDAFFRGGFAAAGVALVIGIPVLRLRGAYFAIGTLALAEAVRVTIVDRFPGQSTLPPAMLRTFDLVPRYELSLWVLVASVLVSYVLNRSRFGLSMKAIREDEEAARSIGINVTLYSLIAFVISAFLAGLAGGTFAYRFYTYEHSLAFSPEWTFDAVIVTYIGGAGTLIGPLLGAAFFIFLRDYLSGNSQLVDTHPIFFGALFILVVLILPGGMVDLSARVRRIAFRLTDKIVALIGSKDPT